MKPLKKLPVFRTAASHSPTSTVRGLRPPSEPALGVASLSQFGRHEMRVGWCLTVVSFYAPLMTFNDVEHLFMSLICHLYILLPLLKSDCFCTTEF